MQWMSEFNENLKEIYESTNNVENLVSEISRDGLERNFLVLMSVYDLKIYNKANIDIEYTEEWLYSLYSNLELAFGKAEILSDIFIKFYELWYFKDEDPIRIVQGSRLNDYCLSQKVYEKIKKTDKAIFKNYWEGDVTDLWESATYLFERYNKEPFSRDRYYRKYG